MKLKHIFIGLILAIVISFLLIINPFKYNDKTNEESKCVELKVPIGLASCIELSEAYTCCRSNVGTFKQAEVCDNRYIPLIIAKCIENV